MDQVTLRKAAELALERLESHEYWMDDEAIKALRQALAQPEQEPVAYEFLPNGELLYPHELERQPDADYVPLYPAPQEREWVGLTGEDIDRLTEMHLRAYPTYPGFYGQTDFARAIDALLKEKNT